MLNPNQGNYVELLKADLRVGQILSAERHEGAHKSFYVLNIDFGPDVGTKVSVAQLTERYPEPTLLIGLQIVAATNLGAKRVAGVISTALLLAAADPSGRSVLLHPASHDINLGSKVA